MSSTEQLPPLATVDDVEAMLSEPLDANTYHVERLLHAASASVRDATGQIITRTTTTAPVVATDSSRLKLYQHPVVSVEQVTIDGVPVHDWRLVGGELERPGGWSADRRDVHVTYTHGWDPVPDALVTLVVQLTLAALSKIAEDGMIGAEPGVRQESVSANAYAVTYGSDDPSPSSVFELSDRTKRWLRDGWGRGSAGMAGSR